MKSAPVIFAGIGLPRVTFSTNDETSAISCQLILSWIVSWPPIANTIADTHKFHDTRRLFNDGPGSVFNLACPNPTAFAAFNA